MYVLIEVFDYDDWLIDWLILTAYELFKIYFMARSSGISFRAHLELYVLYSCLFYFDSYIIWSIPIS